MIHYGSRATNDLRKEIGGYLGEVRVTVNFEFRTVSLDRFYHIPRIRDAIKNLSLFDLNSTAKHTQEECGECRKYTISAQEPAREQWPQLTPPNEAQATRVTRPTIVRPGVYHAPIHFWCVGSYP